MGDSVGIWMQSVLVRPRPARLETKRLTCCWCWTDIFGGSKLGERVRASVVSVYVYGQIDPSGNENGGGDSTEVDSTVTCDR